MYYFIEVTYSPVLSNGNEWALFINFWKWRGPTNTGKESPQSWNVFSTRKVLLQTEIDEIIAKESCVY